MAAPTAPEVLAEAARLVETHGTIREASRASNIPYVTLHKRYNRWRQLTQGSEVAALREDEDLSPYYPKPAPLPPSDITDEEWLDYQIRRFDVRKAHDDAKHYRVIDIPCDGPYALLCMGDPHVDDDGCDWRAILALSDLQSRYKGRMFAVNIGDTTNNWTGRLARLWANQSTSARDARRAAQILLRKFVWAIWLHGNHDGWDGPVGAEWFEAQKPELCVMEDWGAKVTFRSPNGSSFRAWFSHNFKGTSIWNIMHGLLRAVQIEDDVDLAVCGHHHNAGLMQLELPQRGTFPLMLRLRGFKHMDDHARHHQFPEQQHGAAALVVVNPDATGPNRIKGFLDPYEGAKHLDTLLASYKGGGERV